MELIEYNEGLKPLEELLGDRPGDYCTHGSLCVPMPLLQVEGVGTISFPVPAVQAEALVATAERAPCGKGARTLVDSGVRNCWQIDPKRVHPGGRTWADTFGRILKLATEGLGCPGLRAELYKLLVYEPGGFFVSRRDMEKEDGMVAAPRFPGIAAVPGVGADRFELRSGALGGHASVPLPGGTPPSRLAVERIRSARRQIRLRRGCRSHGDGVRGVGERALRVLFPHDQADRQRPARPIQGSGDARTVSPNPGDRGWHELRGRPDTGLSRRSEGFRRIALYGARRRRAVAGGARGDAARERGAG